MMCPLLGLPKMWRAETNACVRALRNAIVSKCRMRGKCDKQLTMRNKISISLANHATTQYVFPELPDFSWSAGKEISSA